MTFIEDLKKEKDYREITPKFVVGDINLIGMFPYECNQ